MKTIPLRYPFSAVLLGVVTLALFELSFGTVAQAFEDMPWVVPIETFKPVPASPAPATSSPTLNNAPGATPAPASSSSPSATPIMAGPPATAPPVLNNPPGLTNTPSQVPTGSPSPSAPPAVPVPADLLFPPDRQMVEYLLQKGYFNPFEDQPFHPDAPVTRAEFMTLLYRASDLTTPFVSEFPYFRDVNPSFWAYAPIEGFRMRRMLHGTGTGYFYPNAPITRMEAAVLLSKTLNDNWLTLTPVEVTNVYTAYHQSQEAIPKPDRYDLARSVYAGFLPPTPDPIRPLPGTGSSSSDTGKSNSLALQAPLTRLDASRMIYHRALLSESDNPGEVFQIPWIPPNVELLVSPTTAIPKNSLVDGENIFFELVRPIQTAGLNLPRGTRFHGKVVEITTDHREITVSLDRANLPSGDIYNLVAELHLTAASPAAPGVKPSKSAAKVSQQVQNNFWVPGNHFTVMTLAHL